MPFKLLSHINRNVFELFCVLLNTNYTNFKFSEPVVININDTYQFCGNRSIFTADSVTHIQMNKIVDTRQLY